MLNKTTSSLGVLATLVGASALAPDAAAQDSFFDIFVDAGECRWRSLDATSPTVFPPGPTGSFDTEMVSLSLGHTDPLNESITDLGGGQFQVDSFFDVTYEISTDGGGGGGDGGSNAVNVVVVWGTTMIFTPTTGRAGEWDTEIVSMDLTGAPPDPGTPLLRLSQGHEHRGHVTILKISDPGETDTFQIDSFFDVFYEISTDGGNTWQAASSSTPLAESEIYVVPEPTSAVLLVLGVTALGVRRRRA